MHQSLIGTVAMQLPQSYNSRLKIKALFTLEWIRFAYIHLCSL